MKFKIKVQQILSIAVMTPIYNPYGEETYCEKDLEISHTFTLCDDDGKKLQFDSIKEVEEYVSTLSSVQDKYFSYSNVEILLTRFGVEPDFDEENLFDF